MLDGADAIDFRRIVGTLAIEGKRIDPIDPNAIRCAWGGVITADGAEAEIATPPVARGPGFTRELDRWCAAGRHALQTALGHELHLSGYSTHFSVAMPDGIGVEVARLYAERFAAPLLLLTELVSSPGVRIRPRAGRTELCTEYVDETRLAAVAAFVAGSVRACADVVEGRRSITGLPPIVRSRIERSRSRAGWYVDHEAFGVDIHAGRSARLRLSTGEELSAQDDLEVAWRVARSALTDAANVADLDLTDRIVARELPLPVEGRLPVDLVDGVDLTSDYAALLDLPVRPAFAPSAEVIGWDRAVIRLTSADRRAFAHVPRAVMRGFVTQLARGELDGVVGAYLAQPAGAPRLARPDAASLHDDVPAGSDLEGPPPSGAIVDRVRRQKWRVPIEGPREGRVREARSRWLLPGLVALALVLLALAYRALAAPGAAVGTPIPTAPLATLTASASPSPRATLIPFAFRSFTATFAPERSTTDYVFAIDDPQGAPLLFYWTIQSSCGRLAQPDQHTAQNGYFHDGCDVATVERAAVVVVRVARATDVADRSTGALRSGASFATYARSARAQDSSETATWPLNDAFTIEAAP